eukprot:TRINITY_DN2098_c0_g1_i1.p1 TRINITY_DN2098_c0_g1~~TRINITY_DN2098_c0_g1_i1.p1  ORF type:complete len:238 (-),score=61.67 TRINITY_DN2098_c0_g1_i1:72-785(-)
MIEASTYDDVCIRVLKDRLRHHLEDQDDLNFVAWRHLNLFSRDDRGFCIPQPRTARWRSTMHKAAELYIDTPFETQWADFIKAFLDRHGTSRSCCRKQQEDESELFCSELVAAVYRDCGVLAGQRDTNSHLPKDFTSAAHALLQLVDATLEDEVLVVLETSDHEIQMRESVKRELNQLQCERMLEYLRELRAALQHVGGRRSWRRAKQRAALQTWHGRLVASPRSKGLSDQGVLVNI